MLLRETYELFVMEKRVENVSPRTLDFYCWSVGRFVDQSPGSSVKDVQVLLWDFLDRSDLPPSMCPHPELGCGC